MNIRFSLLPGLIVAAGMLPAQTPAPQPTKIAVINAQAALAQTKDGQKAISDLQAKFNPKKEELDKKQQDLNNLQTQYRNGANTLSDDAKQRLTRDIDAKTTALKRDTEDAQAELDAENQRIMGELGGKLSSVITKYAADNGYSIVFDVSNEQVPILFASDKIDITRDVIALYDKSIAPAASSAAPASAAPRTTAPAAGSTAGRPAGAAPASGGGTTARPAARPATPPATSTPK